MANSLVFREKEVQFFICIKSLLFSYKKHIFAMRNKINMKNEKMQHAMSYAVILGIYMVIQFYIFVYSIVNFESVGKLFSIMFILLLMTLAVPFYAYHSQKKFRDEKLNGYISYASALSYGIYLFFYASLILAVGEFIYYQFINPNYFYDIKVSITNMMQQLPAEQQPLLEIPDSQVNTPISTALGNIVNTTFLGMIISLITSAIVKKNNNITFTNE